MAITILNHGTLVNDGGTFCNFLITDGTSTYWHSVSNLPLTVGESAVKTLLLAQESSLWTEAQVKGLLVDILDNDTKLTSKLVIALALVTLDEINTVRQALSLPVRTLVQLKSAIRNKLANL